MTESSEECQEKRTACSSAHDVFAREDNVWVFFFRYNETPRRRTTRRLYIYMPQSQWPARVIHHGCRRYPRWFLGIESLSRFSRGGTFLSGRPRTCWILSPISESACPFDQIANGLSIWIGRSTILANEDNELGAAGTKAFLAGRISSKVCDDMVTAAGRLITWQIVSCRPIHVRTWNVCWNVHKAGQTYAGRTAAACTT